MIINITTVANECQPLAHSPLRFNYPLNYQLTDECKNVLGEFVGTYHF